MLLIFGLPASGKSSFIKNFFPPYLFGQVNIDFNKNAFNDNRAYNEETLLWIYPDINESINKNNILKMQNLINNDATLNAKYMQINTGNKSKPIIGCTTVDLVSKLDNFFKNDNERLKVKEQLERRLIV